MKKILDCFEYLKRYQIDLFESICIILECFVLKQNYQISSLLKKSQKRQKIYTDYCQAVQRYTLVTPPNPHLNLAKVLKVIEETPIEDLGLFFDLITQKKTHNQLFLYTTPLEVSILLNALADLKSGESLYNPCFGLGSLFLQIPQGVKVFGEELDDRFVRIASLICLLNQNQSHLICNDVLKQPSFKDKQGFIPFDKIICNPPIHSHLGTNYIKEDERFSGLISKNYPELVFFFHALVHLKQQGVFILRKGIFKHLELQQMLLGRVKCIIDLPKNIFPYQNYDFCVVIVGKQEEKTILYIDARSEYFVCKDGRYNRLNHLDELIALYYSPAPSRYSKILRHIDELFAFSLPSKRGYQLCDVAQIFKGQRVYGSAKDEKIAFYEVGVSDFAPLGFSQNFDNAKSEGQREKIMKYALKPYDILISWRGNAPKITILSPHLSCLCVANMGVLVVRAKTVKKALGIYAYLLSVRGYESLCAMSETHLELNQFKRFSLPQDFLKFASWIDEIENLSSQLKAVKTQILDLRRKICNV